MIIQQEISLRIENVKKREGEIFYDLLALHQTSLKIGIEKSYSRISLMFWHICFLRGYLLFLLLLSLLLLFLSILFFRARIFGVGKRINIKKYKRTVKRI